MTLPSSMLLYKCYLRVGSMFLQIKLLLIDVVSTSVVWSQVRWFFL